MKQSGLQKTIRIIKLVDNGMPFAAAIELVGISKAHFWKMRKKLINDNETAKAV